LLRKIMPVAPRFSLKVSGVMAVLGTFPRGAEKYVAKPHGVDCCKSTACGGHINWCRCQADWLY
jgi:hypothetical protein